MKRIYQRVSKEEQEFFEKMFQESPEKGILRKTVMDRMHWEYNKLFPDKPRSRDSCNWQWYKVQKRELREGGGEKQKVRVEQGQVRAQQAQQGQQAQGLKTKINFSRFNGCELDNIIMDLIDCIDSIKKENAELRKFKEGIKSMVR